MKGAEKQMFVYDLFLRLPGALQLPGATTPIHTNTILGHTNQSGHKQYTCTPSEVDTKSTYVLTICSHLNSSSDSRKARTATIL